LPQIQAFIVTRNPRAGPIPASHKLHIYSAASDGGPLGVGVGIYCKNSGACTISMLLKASEALPAQHQPPNQDDGELLGLVGVLLLKGCEGKHADLRAARTMLVYHTASQLVVDTVHGWLNWVNHQGQLPTSNSPVTRKLMSGEMGQRQ
jgi:hypothetical protein